MDYLISKENCLLIKKARAKRLHPSTFEIRYSKFIIYFYFENIILGTGIFILPRTRFLAE